MSLSKPDARLSGSEGLAADLRALPLAAPSASAWPALEAALRAQQPVRRRARWRYVLPAALAAAVLLAALAPRRAAPPTLSAPPATPVATTAPAAPARGPAASLESLRRQSQELEAWLARVQAANTPLDGQSLMAATEIEDLIGLVDVQLQGAPAQAEAVALWRRRIALLEDLGAIRTANYGLAANGPAPHGGGAQEGAVPESWIN